MTICWAVFIWCRNVTDRQTDLLYQYRASVKTQQPEKNIKTKNEINWRTKIALVSTNPCISQPLIRSNVGDPLVSQECKLYVAITIKMDAIWCSHNWQLIHRCWFDCTTASLPVNGLVLTKPAHCYAVWFVHNSVLFSHWRIILAALRDVHITSSQPFHCRHPQLNWW